MGTYLDSALDRPTECCLAPEPKRLQCWISGLKFGTRYGSKYGIKYATKITNQVLPYLEIGILVTKSAVICLGFSTTTPRRRHINTAPPCVAAERCSIAKRQAMHRFPTDSPARLQELWSLFRSKFQNAKREECQLQKGPPLVCCTLMQSDIVRR